MDILGHLNLWMSDAEILLIHVKCIQNSAYREMLSFAFTAVNLFNILLTALKSKFNSSPYILISCRIM